MIPAITVILIISISALVTKIATIALMYTGLSRQSAKFQARSAFTGVGYATQESENIVNHPVRRKIIMMLMLLGNAGIVSVMAGLLLTFLGNQEAHILSLAVRIALLVGGSVLLWLLFSSKLVENVLSKLVRYALRRYTKLDIMDYSGLLRLSGEYEISEVLVDENDWLAKKSLTELALTKEGLFIIGINRKNGTYLGIPDRETFVCPGDVLVIYGRASAIKRINERKKGIRGNLERKLSEKENRKIKKKENNQDKKSINKNINEPLNTNSEKKDTPKH